MNMTARYRFHLLKYSGIRSRYTCPSCGRKHCFAPYVDDQDQPADIEKYGRCDHESSCGYCLYPPSEPRLTIRHDYFLTGIRKQPKSDRIFNPRPVEVPERICTIPEDIVAKSVRIRPHSHLITFLLTLFDEPTVNGIIEEYRIGVTKSLDTVFYQIDRQGRCRTGKVMKYNPATGHRIKDPDASTPITWVHSLLKQQGRLPSDWTLTQCLFGEHLLDRYPDKPIALVEAEKTAVIAAALMPQCVWVAVGGKTQLGDKVEVLRGRTVIAFPDIDGYDKWKEKVSERPHLNIRISDYLLHHATEEDKAMGADIADLLIRWKHQAVPEVAAKTTVTFPEPPLLRELRRYISPENLPDVMALAEDLDLQLVGVKRL